MKNRIIVTAKGQELQKSLEEEQQLEKHIQQQLKKEQQLKEKNLNDESQSYLQSIFQANNSFKMMESVNKKFQVVSTAKGKNAQEKIINMFVEENNFNKKDMSPYVLHQISKMTEEVVKSKPKKNLLTSSIQNLSMLNNSINNNSQYININDVSQTNRLTERGSVTQNHALTSRNQLTQQSAPYLNNLNVSQNVSIMIGGNTSTLSQQYDDSYLVDKCNAILHCEARVDRIMKRYNKYQKITQDIDTEVKRACERRREFLNQEFLKPPKGLDELRKENGEIAEILERADRYQKNRRQRIIDAMKKKYQKVWGKVHVPELTEKFKELHRQNYKQIVEDDEHETSIQSTCPSKIQSKFSN